MRRKVDRDYNLFFPIVVLNDPRLNATHRMLLSTIATLENKRFGGCIASNAYLANIVGCTPGTVSQKIQELYKWKYVIYNKENKRHGGRGYIRRVAHFVKRNYVPIEKPESD